jgi:hypothetical protein
MQVISMVESENLPTVFSSDMSYSSSRLGFKFARVLIICTAHGDYLTRHMMDLTCILEVLLPAVALIEICWVSRRSET